MIVVGVDTGGTFTDLVMLGPDGLRVHKIPSTPDDPSRSILQGLVDLGAWRAGGWTQRDTVLVHGTTVATNALLERKGARTALVTTAGFEDLLELGRQTRPSLYDFMQQKPPPLAPPELCFGLEERVLADGSVERAPSADAVRRVVEAVRDAGAEAVAISLLFSFLHPDHEELMAEALLSLDPQPFISVSNRVMPQYREYERTSTVAANAYVGPVMAGYLRRLETALGAEEAGPGRVRVMQSSGGSVSLGAAAGEPVRTMLSGPAGGVVGALAVARLAGHPNIITLDMGGTSTDVSLCPGRLQETVAASLGGVPIGCRCWTCTPSEPAAGPSRTSTPEGRSPWGRSRRAQTRARRATGSATRQPSRTPTWSLGASGRRTFSAGECRWTAALRGRRWSGSQRPCTPTSTRLRWGWSGW